MAAETPSALARTVRPTPDAGRIGLYIGLILTLSAVYLYSLFWLNAGGLWRDEANSVQLANLPTFSETWNNLQFDSFPILFFGLLRAWGAVFSPGNDEAYRVLGLLIGLGLVGALWVSARATGSRWPVLSLALLGCNPLFIRYTASMRAYGLGIVLLLLTFAAVWRVLEKLTLGRVALAALSAVLAVQTVYYNSVLLFAICAGAAAAAGLRRDWRKAACLLAIGAPAAASLTIYIKTISQLHDWNFLVHYTATLPWLWERVSEVTGCPWSFGVWLWAGLALGGCAFGVRRAITAGPSADSALIFASVALAIGTAAYAGFLLKLNYRTQPWYYITYLGFAAACLDVIFSRLRWRLAVAGGAVLFVVAAIYPATQALDFRQTNMDIVAARLSRNAAPGDLIVHLRWECAIPFSRYYHGPVEQVSSPPVDDQRFHRYDLVLAQMMTHNAMRPVIEKIGETLRRGGRVWVIGNLDQQSGDAPVPFAPAVKGPEGWRFYGNYYMEWAAEISYFLQHHAKTAGLVDLHLQQPVQHYENLPLCQLSGWNP